MALINGRQYEFSDVTLVMGGRDVSGLRGIKYGSKQEKEVIYGKGNKGMSIQKGNISHEGEITVTQSELETLKLLGGGSVLNLNLNAVVCYGNPSKGDVLITDKINDIQFTEEEKELKQGDKFMEITLPFICLDIEYQSI
ncbi:MAG: hypothetical protein LBG80_04670 [Bacteroidales bacterium]|jgi:uncharacterized protein (UPF0218 family)|nr:hypothetical protein [Bacteroidales bacterium]